MKKNLVSIVVLALVAVTFVLAGAPPIFAAEAQTSGFTALAPIPGLTDISPTAVVNSTSLANFFNNLYKYVIGLAAVLAVIMIIWGGLEISTQDSISKQSAGKEKIQQAILGLVLVLSPVLVFSIINPNILNLSLNLPPLETKSGPPQTTQSTLPPCNSVLTTNCTPAAPLNEGASTATLPTCGPDVLGSCTTASAPACSPGQWCYTTTDSDNVGGVVCSSSQSACTSIYNDQAAGKGGSGIKVTSSCSLCPS